MIRVGKKIRHFRELKGFSQETMSEVLDMSVKAYGRIERDETDISLSRMAQIAEKLDIDLLELLSLGERHFYYVHTNQDNGIVINNGKSANTPDVIELRSELEKSHIIIENQTEEIKNLKKIISLLEEKNQN